METFDILSLAAAIFVLAAFLFFYDLLAAVETERKGLITDKINSDHRKQFVVSDQETFEVVVVNCSSDLIFDAVNKDIGSIIKYYKVSGAITKINYLNYCSK